MTFALILTFGLFFAIVGHERWEQVGAEFRELMGIPGLIMVVTIALGGYIGLKTFVKRRRAIKKDKKV